LRDAFVTPRETAGFLRVGTRTVHRWRKKGLLSAIRLGHSWRFLRSDIERLLRDRHV
jgi:excisionase family DNA binding protein